MPRRKKTGGNRIVSGILRPILGRTKIASMTMKLLGLPRLGNHLAQSGWGRSSLSGRIRLN